MAIDPDVVALIYESAANPSIWPQALTRMAEQVDARGAAIVAIDSRARMRFVADPIYEPTYITYAQLDPPPHNVRPERAFAREYFGFLPDTELCTVEELQNDPLYKLVMHPYGLGWTIGAPVSSPTADLAYFDFCRRIEDRPFGRHEADVLDEYRPHMARAALLATRLQLERAKAASQTLELIGIPGAVVSGSGRALATNPLFDALAPRVRIDAFDRFAIGDQRAMELYSRSVATGSAVTAAVSIPVAATTRAPALIVHLIPVTRSAQDIFGGSTFLVVVTPVEAPTALMTSLLTGLFDLTPAETRVARGISNGMTVAQMATAYGVARETIRNQLKSVMMKTGTHRQSELVGLLLSAAGPRPRLED